MDEYERLKERKDAILERERAELLRPLQEQIARIKAESAAKDKIIEAVERFDAIMYANSISLPLTPQGETPMGALWDIRRAIAELKASRPNPLSENPDVR